MSEEEVVSPDEQVLIEGEGDLPIPKGKQPMTKQAKMVLLSLIVGASVLGFFGYQATANADSRSITEAHLENHIREFYQLDFDVSVDCPNANRAAGSVFMCWIDPDLQIAGYQTIDRVTVTRYNKATSKSGGEIHWEYSGPGW